jgi:hypothetical protein
MAGPGVRSEGARPPFVHTPHATAARPSLRRLLPTDAVAVVRQQLMTAANATIWKADRPTTSIFYAERVDRALRPATKQLSRQT